MTHTARALKIILGRDVWDYERDFDTLWRMNLKGQTEIIVVWADTPADLDVGPVNAEPFITPFDWAVAARVRNPELRIAVVDLRSKDHNEKSELKRSLEPYAALYWQRTQDEKRIPWLRRFTIKDMVQGVGPLHAFLNEPASTEGLQVDAGTALRSFPICQIDLSGKDSHHSIANLVGPLLLLGKEKSNKVQGHRLALYRLLEAAGFIAEINEPEIAPLALGGFGTVRFVMVDDQWHHGWAEWLARRLGLELNQEQTGKARRDRTGPVCVAGEENTGPSLWVSTDPNWLLDRAKEARAAGSDGRFELRLTNMKTSEAGNIPEILLLDLRLFQTRSPAEREFMERAVQFAHAFGGFTEEELEAVREHADDGEAPASALTLLPRILAKSDFSLPIILFSSTRQRGIAEKLRGYGSVRLDFHKPLLLINGDTAALQARQGLETALQHALLLAAARTRIREVFALPEPKPVTTLNSKGRHLEIYTDESGDFKEQESRFGGLVVSYPTEEVARSFANAMSNKGFKWGHHRDGPGIEELGTWHALSKNATPEDAMSKLVELEELARKYEIYIARAFVTTCGLIESALPFDPKWRQSLRVFLELVLDSWESSEPGSVNVFVATRKNSTTAENAVDFGRRFGKVLSFANDGQEEADFDAKYKRTSESIVLCKRQDIPKKIQQTVANCGDGKFAIPSNWIPSELRDDKRLETRSYEKIYIESFGPGDVLPVLNAALELPRRAEWKKNRIQTACGVTILHFDIPRDGKLYARKEAQYRPRLMHFAVDWSLQRSRGDDSTPGDWKKRGFQETLGDGFLLAGISNSAEEVVNGLHSWFALGPNSQPSRARDMAGYRLQQALRGITPDDLLAFANELNGKKHRASLVDLPART